MDSGQFTLHAALEDRHWWFVGRREIICETLRRYVPSCQGNMILEIGCGTGGNLRYLRNWYQGTGVDIAPEAVRLAQERVDFPILEGDFRTLYPETFSGVDAVLLADVLEHVQDDRKFLADILARLRPGGIVLVTVPAHYFLWSNHDEVLGHLRRYSWKELQAVCQGLPVQLEYCTYFNFLLFPLIALYRFLPQKKSLRSDLALPAAPFNSILWLLFCLEKYLLKICPLPWGVSLLMVLKKK
jgi:SAM-dependent methyltransferase